MMTIIVLTVFSLVLFGAEILYRRGMSPRVTRKVAHIFGGIIAAALPILVSFNTAIGVGIVFFVLLGVARKFKKMPSLFGSDGHANGPLLFPLGLVLTALFWWPVNPIIYTGAVIVFTLADAAAEGMGRTFGRHQFRITGQKSIEGSLAFFVICLIVILMIVKGGLPVHSGYLLRVVFGALALTMVEAASSHGWDNVTVPAAAGLALLWL